MRSFEKFTPGSEYELQQTMRLRLQYYLEVEAWGASSKVYGVLFKVGLLHPTWPENSYIKPKRSKNGALQLWNQIFRSL